MLLAAAGKGVHQPDKRTQWGGTESTFPWIPGPMLMHLPKGQARRHTLTCLTSYLYKGMDSPTYLTL